MTDTGPVEEAVLFSTPVAGVALVTLNRPDARNAIDGAITTRLAQIVDDIERDPDIWVAILTGAGDKAFCAGADLKAIASGRIRELSTKAGGFAGFVTAARSKPWICASGGAALAGGCELALACDMIVASHDAVFGLPEVRRGLAAIAGGLVRLPRALPRNRALELIATGRTLSAVEAERWGMVNHVVARSSLLTKALELAAEIAGNAPLAVRGSLAVARRAYDSNQAELFAASAQLGLDLAQTEDFVEGPRAFIEKRAPRWTGR